MSVKSCEKLEKSMVALTVEVSAEEFEAAVEKAYRKQRGSIRVPGFRPGKAPRKIIENMYGSGVFYEEAVNEALPDAYSSAVKEQELEVVGYPVLLLADAHAGDLILKAGNELAGADLQVEAVALAAVEGHAVQEALPASRPTSPTP